MTYLNESTGPTSLKISLSFSSVASYGMLPTENILKRVEVLKRRFQILTNNASNKYYQILSEETCPSNLGLPWLGRPRGVLQFSGKRKRFLRKTETWNRFVYMRNAKRQLWTMADAHNSQLCVTSLEKVSCSKLSEYCILISWKLFLVH